jgi:hypothetical protein
MPRAYLYLSMGLVHLDFGLLGDGKVVRLFHFSGVEWSARRDCEPVVALDRALVM